MIILSEDKFRKKQKGVWLMGVTIKDIAKKTGVSVATVSLVLNKKESRISERTRQIVESAAEEMNYVPNQLAVGLATKKTKTLALIQPEQGCCSRQDFFFSVQNTAESLGYRVLFSSQTADVMQELQETVRRGVEGIIFDPAQLGQKDSEELLAFVQKKRLPIVTLGVVGSTLLPNSISPNHRQGAFQAMEYLLEQGHRKIVFLAPDSAYYTITSELVSGCEDALDASGTDAQIIYHSCGSSQDIAENEAETLLRQNVTAVFASSDRLAADILRCAWKLGIRVPDELSIIGYGNTELGRMQVQALSTVSVHMDRISRKAVNLIRRFNPDAPAAMPEIISPVLILRETTCKRPE